MAIKQITSSVAFQDGQGNVLSSGFLVLDLSSLGTVTGAAGQVVPTRVSVPLTSAGLIPASTKLWANDQLTPTNTFYVMRLFNSNNQLVAGPVNWTIAGSSPIDVSTINP